MISLWTRLDAALLAALDAAMGTAGAYADLQLAAVEVGETWPPDSATMPRALLLSNRASLTPLGHGGKNNIRWEQTLRYTALVVTTASGYAQARADAQALHWRLCLVLATWPAILKAAMDAEPSSTERATLLTVVSGNNTGIEIRGRQGSQTNTAKTWAIAGAEFTIQTTI